MVNTTDNSFEKDFVNTLDEEFRKTRAFKKRYKNYVPTWTQVERFPAIATLFESGEAVDPENQISGRAISQGKVVCFIYNRQGDNQFEDNLTELISIVKNIVYGSSELNSNCTGLLNIYVDSFIRDGGLLHPFSLAKVTIHIKYIDR
jgi:hypothetical protein